MADPFNDPPVRWPVIATFTLAVLITIALFFLHTIILFDVAGALLEHLPQLEGRLGHHSAGKVLVTGCFVLLFAAHLGEAAIWALFLSRKRLVSGFGEGLYFTIATVTTLGYGDVTLPPPWRQLGPGLAIVGMLMFGCSAAFLFVVMQGVWARHL
jgi:voltage-gated potassium channel Kch